MRSVDFGILILGYRRADAIKKTITSLENLASKFGANIYVHIDGVRDPYSDVYSQNVLVKETVLSLNARGTVHDYIFRETNLGTKNSVFTAVSEVLGRHEHILVFEDDLELINDLDIPIDNLFSSLSGNIAAFSLYCNKSYSKVPFVSHRFSSQGWGTSRYYWNEFNPNSMQILNGKSIDLRSLTHKVGHDMSQAWRKFLTGDVDSWAIPWNVYNFLNNRVMIYPSHSFVISNSHLTGAERTAGILFDYDLAVSDFKPVKPEELTINSAYLKHFSIYARLKRRLWKHIRQLRAFIFGK